MNQPQTDLLKAIERQLDQGNDALDQRASNLETIEQLNAQIRQQRDLIANLTDQIANYKSLADKHQQLLNLLGA
jgi:uncharacterized coiled-coil protein SlyX